MITLRLPAGRSGLYRMRRHGIVRISRTLGTSPVYLNHVIFGGASTSNIVFFKYCKYFSLPSCKTSRHKLGCVRLPRQPLKIWNQLCRQRIWHGSRKIECILLPSLQDWKCAHARRVRSNCAAKHPERPCKHMVNAAKADCQDHKNSPCKMCWLHNLCFASEPVFRDTAIHLT